MGPPASALGDSPAIKCPAGRWGAESGLNSAACNPLCTLPDFAASDDWSPRGENDTTRAGGDCAPSTCLVGHYLSLIHI